MMGGRREGRGAHKTHRCVNSIDMAAFLITAGQASELGRS